MGALTGAILLAGGRSRRMGTDKCQLDWEGQPLWCHQLAKLQEINPPRLLISCRKEQHWFLESGAELVFDRVPDQGPLGGLVSALETLPPEGLVAVLSVDLPHFPAAHFRTMLDLTQPGQGVISCQDGFYEPMAAIYPARILTLAAERLASGKLAIQGLIREGAARGMFFQLPIPDPRWYWNWNEPAAPN